MSFVRAPNPIWWLPDHVGLPLNDEYFAFFLTNTLPYLPQNVYRDPQGTTIWTSNIVQFSPAGTLPDNLYFDPTLVYRIEIRHGNTQADALIWEVNNFVPGSQNSIITELPFFGAENQISNSQFAEINFTSPHTISTAGTYEIAPGWELVLTGAGTTILTQNILVGTDNNINNPPFSLRVNNAGWTTAFLRQRLHNNGAIWANGAVMMSVTARAQTTPQQISLVYQPSVTNIATPVAQELLGTGAYQVVQGALNLPASVNTDLNDVAYVDAIVQLPPTGIIDISNIQILGQGTALLDPTSVQLPEYEQQTIERGIDHLFHAYQPAINFKPIPSVLVGWDFALNPTQTGFAFVTTGMGAYTWDQTICFSGPTGFNITRNSPTQGFQAISTGAISALAMVQYLSGDQVKEFISNPLSVNVNAFAFTVTDVNCKVYLYIGGAAATFPVLPAILGTLASDGNFTLTALNWSEIPRGLYGLATADVTGITASSDLATVNYDYGFSGWQVTDSTQIDDTTKFAIVVTFSCPTNATTVAVRSISVVPGDIPTRPAPQTEDQVLRECQYYYEQSYAPGIAPGTATFANAKWAKQLVGGSAPINMTPGSFILEYKTVKRIAPNITIYRPRVGTADNVDSYLYNAGADVADGATSFSTNWAPFGATSVYNVTYEPATANVLQTNGAAASNPESFILYHYTLNSQLGVV